ncbi:LysR substrate-binding domain-containing protein [Alicycliphilus denitrificans]|uniref:LysR substrate-binding domain-containing protein n=1 Tax=Alicycliphilus denitrificans TaxID=179636 RepID=UPI0001D9ED98|nr:LysR substrate-binding domain-containing protein [Alicycliphilus denitrificans]ADU98705.1 LysR substrate-binding protein [Alicycliphilus denitrificans BC]
MRMHSPSLPELHAFAAAARLGSFSRAAGELHVTQGAISRAIARLEEHLGVALFEREGRRSVLTRAGADYLDAVGPSITAIESATLAVRTRRSPRQLRLSVPPTLFSHWLIPRLPDFSARHPGIGLSFAPYRRDDPLSAPDIDAWIRIGQADWPAGITAEYLVGRELVPLCRPADLPQLRTPADLLARPLLFHTNYPGNWAHWFANVGCTHGPLVPAADFDQVSLLVQAVIAGMGVAVVQRALVEPELAAGRIAVAIALEPPVLLDRGYHLCRPAGRAPSPALENLRAWLLEQAAACA